MSNTQYGKKHGGVKNMDLGYLGKCSVWVRMRKPWQDGTSSLVFRFCPNDNEMISSCLLLGWICLSRKILEPSSSYCFSTVKIVPQYKSICFIFFPDLLFKLIKLKPIPWKGGFCSLSTHQISQRFHYEIQKQLYFQNASSVISADVQKIIENKNRSLTMVRVDLG